MMLYHGTYDDKLISIIKTGFLDNTLADETTQEIDEKIEKYSGVNVAENALYLTNDIQCTKAAYDFEFSLEVSVDLDPNFLFVADNEIRDEMLGFYKENEEEHIKGMKELVKKYTDSFISYEEYLKVKDEYDENHFSEFLYFKTVDISHFTDDVVEHLKDNEEYEEDLKNLNLI